MDSAPRPLPRVTPFGDAALLVDWGGPPNPASNARVHALAAALDAMRHPHPSLAALIPAYASLLVTLAPPITPAALTHLTTLVARLLDEISALEVPSTSVADTTPLSRDHHPFAPAPGAAPNASYPVGRLRIVPVVYGDEFGPDLEAVATYAGVTPNEVVQLHTTAEQRVYMLGFAPGYPYLGDLPPQLAVPRLPTPRQRVPAGSVAIAGRQTGIYPRPTPGGWRILGRTPITLFDPYRDPPAYFAPGDRVRFHPIPASHWDRYLGIPADWDTAPPAQTAYPPSASPPEAGTPADQHTPPHPRAAEPAPAQSVPVFEVLAPGLLTTIQDLHGRVGYQRYGVATAGALDALAAEAANRLLGNHPNDPLLEITANGPTLRCLANTRVALTGADLQPRLDNLPVPTNQPFAIHPGQTLKFGTRRAGARAYLAVEDGFHIPRVLGSAATDLHAGFGGHHGRPLQSGDLLHTPVPIAASEYLATTQQSAFPHHSQTAPQATTTGVAPPAGGVTESDRSPSTDQPGTRPHAALVSPPTSSTSIPALPSPDAPVPVLPSPNTPVRVLPGPHPHHFAPDALQRLCDQTWRITPQSNRMGYRLQGQPLQHRTPGAADVTSLGLPNGAIQVAGDGQPIVLLADHQPTGGYAVLACVLHADLPLLAQCLPGDTLRFELATLPEQSANPLTP